MKTLYLECNMGAAGDMLTAALLELHPDPQDFLRRLNGLGLPGVEVTAAPSVKCGITGTHVSVTVHGEEEGSVDASFAGHTHEHSHDLHGAPAHGHSHGEHSHEHEHVHEQAHADGEHGQAAAHSHEDTHSHGHGHHHHSGMHDIEHILSHLALPEQVRRDALAVYGLIAEAESHAHGRPVEEIHFHEVGTLDAVADVTAVCMLLAELAPDRVVCSPVHVGSGHVHCAHGVLPVPAPATAHILRGVPTYGGAVRGELCTPTGAALLKHFASSFGPAPVMKVEKIGYGMGNKDFEAMNGVRAMLGETADSRDSVAELCCNLDDMTPEAVGFAQERLLEAGALDVYTTAVGMKKNRPGVLLTCMCLMDDREKMVSLLFLHTSTLGIRESVCNRYTLFRSQRRVDTKYGPVRVKESSGWGAKRCKPEYDDVAKLAREHGVSLAEIEREIGS